METEGLKKITNSWQQRVWEDRLFSDPAVQQFIKDNEIIVTDWREVMARFKEHPQGKASVGGRVGESR